MEKTHNFAVEDGFVRYITLTEEQYRFYKWLLDNDLLNSECRWTESSDIYYEKI